MTIHIIISYHFSIVLVTVEHVGSGLVLSGQDASDPVLALAGTLTCRVYRCKKRYFIYKCKYKFVIEMIK